MSDKYAAIAAQRGRFPVRMMCAALGVSVGGFYDAQRRPRRGSGAARDERLLVEIRAVVKKYRKRYGAPRVHQELREAGTRVAKHRVARFMQRDHLVARPRRRFVRTTDSAHTSPIAENLLQRNFAVAAHPELNRVWVSDMTYVPTRAGWLFLAVVLDLASRRIVGWATSTSMAVALPLAALQMALQQRLPHRGLILHSDRGSQYAAQRYRDATAAAGAVQSMSRKGDCWDNAVAESFFATLEHELLAHDTWARPSQAHEAIAEFIDVWYNQERRHSRLNYLSPVQFEQARLAQSARAA